MPKDSKDKAFARTRDALVEKSAFNKLNQSPKKNE
jgi:hypothetical protein